MQTNRENGGKKCGERICSQPFLLQIETDSTCNESFSKDSNFVLRCDPVLK